MHLTISDNRYIRNDVVYGNIFIAKVIIKIKLMFSEKTAKILSYIGLGLIILSALAFIIFRSWDFSLILNEAIIAQYGDFIGGVVGSLFAFVGVILYYVALSAQRDDIQINRSALSLQIKALEQQIEEFKAQTEELQETRKVYEEQTNLYREQTSYYKQQVFELKSQTEISYLKRVDSNFYNLLRVFIKVKDEHAKKIELIIEELKSTVCQGTIIERCKTIMDSYENISLKKSNTLSIYFKTIYRLMMLIDSIKYDDEKKQYVNILRSQLSLNDLIILYYNYFLDINTQAKTFILNYNILGGLTMFDKFETATLIEKSHSLSKYFKRILEVYNSNLKRYSDIEGDDINITEDLPFINIKSSYGLEIINDIFKFSLKYQLDVWKSQDIITETENINIVKMFIYDYFFLSKFKIPKEIIKIQKTEDDNNCTFYFIVELKDIYQYEDN